MKKYIVLLVLGVCFGYIPVYADCIHFTSNMYRGLSGVQVSNLQTFLAQHGYISNTLVTGYFGNITFASVKKYQLDHGIDTTGYVGPLTRASIENQGCGVTLSSSGVTTTTSPAKKLALYYYSTEGDLSVGSKVTLHGSGFSPLGNTVVFGTIAINNLISQSGTDLTFVIPDKPSISCPTFSLQGCNVVGQTASQSDFYQVYVINSGGTTSNTISLSISNVRTTIAPTVSNLIGPFTLQPGTQGIWTLVVNSSQDTSIIANVDWGDTGTDSTGSPTSKTVSVQARQDQSLIFTHSYQESGFHTITFTVIDDVSGLRTSRITSVNISSVFVQNNNILSLNALSPLSAKVGTQITVQGTGFSSTGNSIQFGAGGIRNLSSYNNGTLMYFAVPTTVNPCDAINQGFCQATPVQITPGMYQVSVTNAAGQTSGTYYFSVVQ